MRGSYCGLPLNVLTVILETLLGKRDLADVVKFKDLERWKDLSWIIRMGPK